MQRRKSVLYASGNRNNPDGDRPTIPVPTMKVDGVELSPERVRKIRADLLSGCHPQLSAIARRNGVPRKFVKRLIDNDPELRQCYEDALAETAEQIEKAAVDMCLDDGINPVAREKMIEFCLPKMMPERYGDNAHLSDAARNLPRISVSLTLPVVEKKEEVIEVHSESPLNESTDANGK